MKRKDPFTVQVIRQLADIKPGHSIFSKYIDPGIPFVNISINGTVIKKNMIEFGAVINVIFKNIINYLKLEGLRPIATVFHLVDRSTMEPKGFLEDIVVVVDSWE